MIFPEIIVFLLFDQFIIGIVGRGLFEGRVSRQHDKEYDSSRKDVATFSFILFCWNLGGHIAFSAEFSFQDSRAVLAAKETGEPEICDFEYEYM